MHGVVLIKAGNDCNAAAFEAEKSIRMRDSLIEAPRIPLSKTYLLPPEGGLLNLG